MTVIKRQRSDNYAVVPNDVANDARLSFEARGLLVYLLAKPNDWYVSIADLMKQGQIGRDKAYRLLNELIAAGYVERDREQDEATGRVKGFNYTIYDVAVHTTLPLPENQEVADPLPDSPDTENQDTNKKELTSTKEPPNPPDGGLRFASLWEVWPADDRGNRDNAEGAWGKLSDASKRMAIDYAETAVGAVRRRKGRIPALVRYIRERMFEEFDGAPPIDVDGRFEIKPGMPEWGPWLGWIREKHGQRGVDSIVKIGVFRTETRWPEGSRRAA
jgi:hypothetical protein